MLSATASERIVGFHSAAKNKNMKNPMSESARVWLFTRSALLHHDRSCLTWVCWTMKGPTTYLFWLLSNHKRKFGISRIQTMNSCKGLASGSYLLTSWCGHYFGTTSGPAWRASAELRLLQPRSIGFPQCVSVKTTESSVHYIQCS